ncbi:cell division protein FtsW [Anaerosacchariphilus sp. NSJ-68]|uniref:Probable peptidoglycan glycosyltransferase FtsW n=2 Tax=Lachnospiraceae TaxID=186803 RepID=A0A923RM06_9FIRM|nr:MULTISPECIES: putative peptidoglycan glycosyltransferase FtsW [Lachnospiraceae]MBC5658901.1 cell division protein FtsW [Anaerosacchariphilus hominis]MBC5698830.1 cell division protein FtsW [Roseburia difficilis]
MSGKKKKRRFLSSLLSYDMNLIVAVIFLMVFGLIMIYSASYYTASMSEIFHHDPTYFLKSQVQWSVIGLAVMLVVANIDYHRWRYFAGIGLVGSVVLILLLKVPGLGVTVKGATRWLRVPGLGQFQVAEPVKVAMILFSAALISSNASKIKDLKTFIKLMIPTAVVSFLILKISNNMSTATIVFGICFLMAFMVYPKYYPFFIAGGAGAAGIGALILYLKKSIAAGTAGDGSGGFRSARILAWLDPYSYESDKAYQSLQALYAIGSGGLFGKGLGNSIQKLGSIPEPYNDMIFSIICEELGIFGAGLVILMFVYLLYRLYSVAQQAEDVFGRLLVIGVFSHVALQVVLNLMVVTSLFPTTGVTLPFFSYGGTASVFLLIEIGMVLNVEKRSRFKREKELREARME